MVGNKSAQQKLERMIQESSGLQQGSSDVIVASVGKVKGVPRKLSTLLCVKFVNGVLFWGVIICIVFLYNQFSLERRLMDQGINLLSVDIPVREGSRQLLPVVQNLSYYVANMSKRNIFRRFEKIDTDKKMMEDFNANRTVIQKTKGLRLVGISWFEDVESASVMIEDLNKKVTFFLKKGEEINGVQIKTIYADSVEFGYQDEEVLIYYDKSQM